MPHLTPMLSGSLGWALGWIHFKTPQVPFEKHSSNGAPRQAGAVFSHNPFQVGNEYLFLALVLFATLNLFA